MRVRDLKINLAFTNCLSIRSKISGAEISGSITWTIKISHLIAKIIIDLSRIEIFCSLSLQLFLIKFSHIIFNMVYYWKTCICKRMSMSMSRISSAWKFPLSLKLLNFCFLCNFFTNSSISFKLSWASYNNLLIRF